MTRAHRSLGRHVLPAVSLFACAVPSHAGAGESGDASVVPPVFSDSMREAARPAPIGKTVVMPAPASRQTGTISRTISDGFPRFDAKLPEDFAIPSGILPAGDPSKPVLMEPYTVFDARLPEFSKPDQNLLEKVFETGSVFRHDGKKLSSELTFLDLGVQSNWKAPSRHPPPAITLRFTLSW